MNSRPQGVPGKRVVQPVEATHIDPVCRPERPPATIDEDAPHHARLFSDRTKARQHAGVKAWLGLDLDRHELIAAPEQEVRLRLASGMRRPVVQVLEQSSLLPVDPQRMRNPAFKECSSLFGHNRSAEFLHRPHQARIDPIELWMTALTHPQPRLEGG